MTGGTQDADRLSVHMSSFCTYGECVGVVMTDGRVSMIDTKGEGAGLRFTREEWAAFVAGVKAGEFDLDESA